MDNSNVSVPTGPLLMHELTHPEQGVPTLEYQDPGDSETCLHLRTILLI